MISKKPGKLMSIDIDAFMSALEKAYETWQAPVITLMACRGATPFELLVSTVLSLRTRDEVTARVAARLLKAARTPQQILALGEEKLAEIIQPVGFYRHKSRQLIEISRRIINDHNGQVPDTMEALLQLPGVGRKTANLVLAEAFDQAAVCVDTHVHRISNRIGYVETRTPEQTEFALRRQLPSPYWKPFNRLLVAFGQVICRPVSPFCSRCPVQDRCPKINVGQRR